MHRYKLAVGAIFKNEAHIFREWLEHYINQGVEKFYLIDNGSTDNYMSEIREFSDKFTLFQDSKRHAQYEHYNKYFLPVCKESEWLIICDLDEFFYARNGHNKITEYLQKLPENVSTVMVPWKMFGSNGHKTQPKRVVRSFTLRELFKNKECWDGNSKGITRTSKIDYFDEGLHTPKITGGNVITPNNKTIDLYERFRWSEDNLRQSSIHCNHYPLQSYEWFMKVKATRGDAMYSKNDNLRNESYFRRYDSGCNVVLDTELKMINRKLDLKYIFLA
jgi:hypothetical protein